MEQIINWFLANGQILFNIIAGSVLVISYIVKLTPTLEDDKWLAKVVDLLKKLSLYKEQ